MHNFEDFTDDEHIMLSHIISCDALIGKVAELTGYAASDIRKDIALHSGKYLNKLSRTECMDLIKHHRESVKSHRRARKIIQNNINN